MNTSLLGDVALVTGANDRIGAATAKILAARGVPNRWGKGDGTALWMANVALRRRVDEVDQSVAPVTSP